MKNILTFLFSIVLTASAFGQYSADCAQINLSIENAVLVGTTLEFDVKVVSGKPIGDPCHKIFYGNGQIVMKIDETKFSNPVFSKKPGSSEMGAAFAQPLAADFPQPNTVILATNLLNSESFFPSYYDPEPEIATIEAVPIRIITARLTNFTGNAALTDAALLAEAGITLDFTGAAPFGGGESELDAFETKGDTYSDDPASDGATLYPALVNNAVLPVKLTRFEANKYNRTSSVIRWETASESNTSHFLVQRFNSEFKDWNVIGSVSAEGNSSDLNQYTFVDKDVYDGLAIKADYQYRIKIMDNDGKFEFSNIDNVNFAATLTRGQVKVFPNPAVDGVHVQFDGELPVRPTDIVVYDVLGKMVHNQSILEGADYAYINLRASNISAGSYVVQFVANDALVGQQKLVVQGK